MTVWARPPAMCSPWREPGVTVAEREESLRRLWKPAPRLRLTHLCADVTMSKKLTAMSLFVVFPVSSYPRASPATLL